MNERNDLRGLWRGKRKDNGRWIEGYLLRYGHRTCIYCAYKDYFISNSKIIVSPFDVIFVTLGECTGLHDTNGKPIFEGDICTVATPNIGDDEYGVIEYDDNEAVFIVNFGTYTINFCNNINSSMVEIIGNIHDFPELLKGGK